MNREKANSFVRLRSKMIINRLADVEMYHGHGGMCTFDPSNTGETEAI